MLISVVIPTHQPRRDRLQRVIAALDKQSLPAEKWELIVVDNLSDPPVRNEDLSGISGTDVRLVNEERLGLTPARIRGIREARGEIIVFVDDDNVLERDYLFVVAKRFTENPKLGACGGKALPEFETPPPEGTKEFWSMLALRDLGSHLLAASGAARYPACAPIGAGMAVRRNLACEWSQEVESDPVRLRLDRSGASLGSAGDNDLVLTLLQNGFAVEYVPELVLTHLIPRQRTTRKYLAELAYASSKTWVQVLRLHSISPYTSIGRFGAILRKVRSFFVLKAWRSPADYVRWKGTCGIFDGRVGHKYLI